jgi:uncharacterized membrane protein YedE/YeeE
MVVRKMNTVSIAPAALGGLLIGLSAASLLLFDGRIAGISGVVGGLADTSPDGVAWRVWFLGGMFAGAAALRVFAPYVFGAGPSAAVPTLALAGALVGYGTRLSNGCTSGHGVCGLSRRSPRSLAAVMTFMGVAMAVVYVVRHILVRAA